MQSLTEKIIDMNQANRVLNDMQLRRMLGGGNARRYGLVNRALKMGELHRLNRGLYVLDNKYRDYPLHPFALAQALMPGSYVSFETALSHHGWIPEAVCNRCNSCGSVLLNVRVGWKLLLIMTFGSASRRYLSIWLVHTVPCLAARCLLVVSTSSSALVRSPSPKYRSRGNAPSPESQNAAQDDLLDHPALRTCADFPARHGTGLSCRDVGVGKHQVTD